MTPGKLLMIDDKLATMAKKPITSDEVKNVAMDKNQTPSRSKCCFIINRDKLYVVHVMVCRNLQSRIHPALKQ